MIAEHGRTALLIGLASLLAIAVTSEGLAKSRLRTISPRPVNDPTADLGGPRDTQSETTVAALGKDGQRVVVAYNDSGSFNFGDHFTGFARSTNAGASFTDEGFLPDSDGGDVGEPVLAARTGTNTVYLATLALRQPSRIQVFKSTDGGATFGAPVDGTPGLSSDVEDKEWLAVDNFDGAGKNNVYLCSTRRFGGGVEIRFTRSTDGGMTFGPVGGTLISTGGQGCYVAVGPAHEVYVFYYRGTDVGGSGGDNKLFVRRSTDRGVSFGPEAQVADLQTTTRDGDLGLNGGLATNSFPQAAVNPVSGDLVAVFNDDDVDGVGDNGNVFYVESTDDGATWSAPVRVNDDGAHDQFFPTVAISPDGKRLMFGYYSRSHDPRNLMFHRRGRAAVMDTTTGAIDERPSFQLGPDTPIVIGQDSAVIPTYMGGYDQIATNDSTFFSSWADNRDGNSFHAHQPDVRLARIDHSAPVTDTDVAVTVKAVPATIAEGETTNLRVKTTATGNSARDVFVSLAPPKGLEFQSVGGGSSCRLVGGFVGCSLGTIPAGTTATRSVVALGTHAGDRTATARATTSDNDANHADNVGAAPVIVNPGPTVTQTFSTGDISVPITDATTVDVPLSVTPNRAILDVDARMRLNHTFDGDLEISLVSPGGGTVVTMSDNNGGTGEDYGTGTNDCAGAATTFDDEAATSITAGTPPFAGSFSPAPGSLSAMDGGSARGTWNLRVADQGGGDVGTIGCFELTILQARRSQ